MGTALAVYIGEIGSPFAVSLVFPAYVVGLMPFAPARSAVADVTGSRRAVLVGTGATLAVLPLTLVGGICAPVGLRALYAAVAAGFSPVMLAVASQRGGDERRGREAGFFNSARAMGFTAGQLTVGALLGLLAPDALYLVLAGISLLSTLTVALIADPSSGPAAERSVSLSAVVASVRRRLLPSVGERAHRRNGLRWLYVALALRNMTVLGVVSLMPVCLTDRLGLSAFLDGRRAGEQPRRPGGLCVPVRPRRGHRRAEVAHRRRDGGQCGLRAGGCECDGLAGRPPHRRGRRVRGDRGGLRGRERAGADGDGAGRRRTGGDANRGRRTRGVVGPRGDRRQTAQSTKEPSISDSVWCSMYRRCIP
jgi:hypothetical protein